MFRRLVIAMLAFLSLVSAMILAQAQRYEWQLVESPTENHLFSIYMLSSTEGWAVGN